MTDIYGVEEHTPMQTEGTCEKCGRKGTLTRTGDGALLCADCLKKDYGRCPTCGQYVPKSDIASYDPGFCCGEIILCSKCAEKYGY